MEAALGRDRDTSSSLSSDDAESRLEDSAGIGMSVAAAFGLRNIDIGGDVVKLALE